MPSRSQTPTVLSERMVWHLSACMLVGLFGRSCQPSRTKPSDVAAHYSAHCCLAARTSRPFATTPKQIDVCYIHRNPNSSCRVPSNKAALRPVVVYTDMSHSFASVAQLAIYPWYSRCSGCVSRKAYLGGECHSGVSFRRTQGRTLLSLKPTLGDHRIPPNSCTPLTSCKLAIFSIFLESFRTRAVSDNA